MKNPPRLGPPQPPEARAWLQSAGEWLQSPSGPPPELPDPLDHYRKAWGRRPKQPITMRVEGYLLELTREVARQHGMGYQNVIGVWIKEGLRRSLRIGAGQTPKPSRRRRKRRRRR